MPGINSLEQHRREELRASILQILNVSRPVGCSERLMLLTLGDVDERIGSQELRRELDYLSDKSLVEIEDRDAQIWKCDLTADGVDVVEGAVKPPAGIARIDWD